MVMKFSFWILAISIWLPAPFYAQAQDGGADREWAKRKSRINKIETKMKDARSKLESYIRAKNSDRPVIDEKGNRLDILKAIAETHKTLKENESEFNKEVDDLKYRFPEEGALIERRYVPRRSKTIEQIEREMGLDYELTKIKKKVDEKYAPFTKDIRRVIRPEPERAKVETRKPASSEASKKRLKLSQ